MIYLFETDIESIEIAAGEYHPEGMANVTRGELKGFDYISETAKTASNSFTGSTTPASELASDLRIFIEASRKLDRHKKVLFRKKTRFEVGFHPMYDIDPANPVKTVAECFNSKDQELLHGIIGMATETGELAEIAYARIIHDTPFDQTNVREEIGDNLWYLSRLIAWANTTFLTEMKRNIAKLRLCHGEVFDKERDSNRDLESERKLLEDKQ